jgi:hypothetical protein
MKGKTNLKIVVTKIMVPRFNQNREIGTHGMLQSDSFVTKSTALCTCCILLLKFTRVAS